MTRVTQAHIEARTGEILDAALTLFAQRGIDRTTVQEIAVEAGLSTGAIYRYFAGKEQLLEAVFERSLAANRELFRRAAASEADPLARLLTVGREVLGEGEPCPQHALALELVLASDRERESVGRRYRALNQEVIGLIESVLRDARDAGEVAADIDLHDLALILGALVPGLQAMVLVLGEEVRLERILALVGTLLRRSARPAPGQ